MENPARYIIQASFSQERMTYLPEPVPSKDNRQDKIFDALDWLEAMIFHIPTKESKWLL